MPKDIPSLHRQPFLTPIWLVMLGAIFAAGCFFFAVWTWSTADSTTVIVVRHAEQNVNAGSDSPLSEAGEARAASLARMFGDSRLPGRLDAIYVSSALRDRMTAAPLAAGLGLVSRTTSTEDASDLARRVLREHAGGRVLIVIQRGTVAPLVAALSDGTRVPPIEDLDYGTVYVVSVPRIGRANLFRMHY